MCHGHPRWHPCSHTSINWHYCPSALIDLETGVETPCTHLSYATAQPSNADCPLVNCQFKAMGGSWTCCQCGQGPNTQGWCMMPRTPHNTHGMDAETSRTCDHGCCVDCVRYPTTRAATPDMTFSELRKGTASRKFGYGSATRSHRRGSALSKISGFQTVDEEDEASSPSTSGCSSISYKSSAASSTSHSSAASSRGSKCKGDAEYNSKRHKSSSGKSSRKTSSSKGR
ncbi:hypothetical protein C8034_v000660 [Colletotrichum sidae]|uniref:Uncharacterized protein n=2 Tax=Colletotrichum orbiculare species complex TaxID=2707354 RepID=A0A4V3HSH1_9PEZI|nr:hypothetical protein C8035_v009735 [Colletotrichum spinosum]TEA16953.1 hypothetical protein C8034_v000660 [Colletotrichum sidae]